MLASRIIYQFLYVRLYQKTYQLFKIQANNVLQINYFKKCQKNQQILTKNLTPFSYLPNRQEWQQTFHQLYLLNQTNHHGQIKIIKNNPMGKILVTGATGNLGRQVLQRLIQKTNAENLSAIARDPSKLASFKSEGVNVIEACYA
jgi:FlaA1/EpsC-like NDP-sugar epimerase